MQTCDIQADEFRLEPFIMVIFGGGGDLSRRKLVPAIYHLFKEREMPDFAVLGFGKPSAEDGQYREIMRQSLRAFDTEAYDEAEWEEFGKHLFYLSGVFEKEGNYRDLQEKIDRIADTFTGGAKNVIYYLAVPPREAPVIVGKLKKFNLCRGTYRARIIVEKPFGHDLQSAQELNRILDDAFDEDQIYRIDHYLGKDPVQNIIFFRFSNTIFEEIWNRRYIDNVQITVAEEIGIDNRGAFYESAGVIRDIVQNHIMQLFGLVAMEAPIAFKASFIWEERLKVFRSIRSMSEEYVREFTVRGQYAQGWIRGERVPGYREEERVFPLSNTATFFAGKFYVDNLRWAGVPFYIRTGKRMARRVTEICLQFKQLPLRLFGRTCDVAEPNILILTIQPDEKIALRFGVKFPYSENQLYPVSMVFSYKEVFKTKIHPPYERLLMDCMKGDQTLFVREDAVEEMWSIVDPIISVWESEPPDGFPNYKAGEWGPPAAQHLLERENRRWLTE
ncbi:MAG: glucose-6-phosphate dehydrogenase [Alphaproteobacteria bacterium]|uniref:Glucose-6-phosphate 1-dehydrogenase n=1 Tax=Candidatus Nitrobium versatile TaxID=2884831 RepID=A0A953M0N1_9BACT|nr:glucose-6-phosphate dehydrogenase [Candidatus Nitrobium versatile]